ncbi:DUF308 domain-containing protein [Muricauda sp. 334s03]|uniref:DUF308 domain-containing protein n=1 Tax=Flagellimonas yonaguniensis TaxID=3031325 RepID=A0ABT5Y2L7_9FLAO|nr:DUF308 domain-containing protein [[Muricauda] yonaguniensis]MDF0717697.1 DUF308 domain-containing protein [[Muricauda] yonaguniensis]
MNDFIETELKYWYVPLILGILFIGLGILVFATPEATFLTIAVLFSIGFVVSGIVEVMFSLSNRGILKNWGWHLVGGIITLILGILLSLKPDFSALVLSLYIGFWLLFRSIVYTSSAFELKSVGIKNWGWMFAFGIIGIIFSFILLWNPLLIGIGFVFWIGYGLIILGIINIILGFSIRRFKKDAEEFIDGMEDQTNRS